MTPGQIIDNEWAAWGINLTVSEPSAHPAMIFNANAPTGADYDLGTPNQAFGGPGLGAGGGMGQPGQNSIPQGNILILSENGSQSNPNDYSNGGRFVFTFTEPTFVDSIQMLDIETLNSSLKLYDAANNLMATFPLSNYGNNGIQTVVVQTAGVSRMEVKMPESGAIASIALCRAPGAPTPTPSPTPVGPQVTSFTLINALTDAPIATFNPLASGAVLNLATLPTHKLNIRANVTGATESVYFQLSGEETYHRIENIAPYALKGDDNGDYSNWIPSLGSYTLQAIPYTENGAQGTAGTGLTISFTVINQPPLAVTSFTLINARTDAPITTFNPLTNGAVLDLSALPTYKLNIRANVTGTVQSVYFQLSGPESYHRIENSPPYALKGDDDGDYNQWVPAPGTYTLTATPYTENGAEGVAGTPLTITFTVQP